MKFDEAVDDFAASVGDAAGVEVAEELSTPLPQGASETSDLGDPASGEVVEDLEAGTSPGGVAGLVIERTPVARRHELTTSSRWESP